MEAYFTTMKRFLAQKDRPNARAAKYTENGRRGESAYGVRDAAAQTHAKERTSATRRTARIAFFGATDGRCAKKAAGCIPPPYVPAPRYARKAYMPIDWFAIRSASQVFAEFTLE